GKTAAEAFANANWRRVLPQLLRGAAHYLRALGLAEGRNTKPWIEGPELVNEALDDLYADARTWQEHAGQSESKLVGFLSKTMQSNAINHCMSHAIARRVGMEAADRLPDEDATPSQRVAYEEIRQRLEEIYADDDEARRAGYRTHEGIAEAMG